MHDEPSDPQPQPWRRGRGRVQRELGRHWFYVDLSLEVRPAERHAFTVELEEPAGGWEVAHGSTIEAAVRFVEEKALYRLGRVDLGALAVTLKRVSTSSRGTTAPLVFYATLLALEEALELKVPDFKMDWETLELRLKIANGKQNRRP